MTVMETIGTTNHMCMKSFSDCDKSEYDTVAVAADAAAVPKTETIPPPSVEPSLCLTKKGKQIADSSCCQYIDGESGLVKQMKVKAGDMCPVNLDAKMEKKLKVIGHASDCMLMDGAAAFDAAHMCKF